MLDFCIPSTKTSSPTEKTFSSNPKDGVVRIHVKIPLFSCDSTLVILIPLVLLIAKSSADWSDIPLGGTSIIKSVIELTSQFCLNNHSIFYLNLAVLVPLLITDNCWWQCISRSTRSYSYNTNCI